MRYKKFGNTGLDISALTIGTYAVGNAAWGETGKDAYVKAIRKMVELGANHMVMSRVMRKFCKSLVEIYYRGRVNRPLVTSQRSGRKGSRAAVRRSSCP